LGRQEPEFDPARSKKRVRWRHRSNQFRQVSAGLHWSGQQAGRYLVLWLAAPVVNREGIVVTQRWVDRPRVADLG
jgi:hypothetical protein